MDYGINDKHRQMKTGEAELWLKTELNSIYEENEAASIASRVMEHITRLPKSERLLKKDEPLIVQQLHHLTEVHHRLMHNEPVQYALGESFFYGMKLFVDKNVLIPRPETEELVQWILDDQKTSGVDVFDRSATEADKTKSLKVLDVGTGSGCIALALKKTMPKAEVWACDNSEDALNIARRNGSQLDIRVDFVGLDFLNEEQRKQLPTVHVLVSNPPYIPIQEKDGLQPNVLEYEPHTALFVPNEDPLLFYKALAVFGKEKLYDNGVIYAEIHEALGSQVAALFQQHGYQLHVKKDMQGKDRMIKAWRQ